MATGLVVVHTVTSRGREAQADVWRNCEKSGARRISRLRPTCGHMVASLREVLKVGCKQVDFDVKMRPESALERQPSLCLANRPPQDRSWHPHLLTEIDQIFLDPTTLSRIDCAVAMLKSNRDATSRKATVRLTRSPNSLR